MQPRPFSRGKNNALHRAAPHQLSPPEGVNSRTLPSGRQK